MKTLIGVTCFSAFLALSAQARTWTSADGSKTFEADFKSLDGDTVTVVKGYSQRSFKLSILSEADQKWAKEEAARLAKLDIEKAETKAAETKAANGSFAKSIANKLEKLDGKRFKKYKFDKTPEYYILYYTASW